MVWTGTRLASALCIFVAVSVNPAKAQIMTPVNTGPEPELGIHLGGFMFYPTLDVSGRYNDNVLAVNTGAQSDFSYDVHPQFDLESTWTHYLLALKAQYDLHQYDKLSSQNTSNYLLSGEARFDIGVDSQFDATSEYDRMSELPGNTNVTTNAAKPTTYFRWNSAADFKHVFNRLQVDLGGSYTTLRFRNTPAVGGGTIFEVDRDRDVSVGYFDLGYQFSPGYQIFARGTWNERDYRLVVSNFRNSSGYEAVAGLRTQITHLIDGQVYVGYLSQDYKAFSTVAGLDYGLQLNWAVTRLSTITADISRSIEETDEIGASSYFATIASLGVTHALTRTVTLNANVSYTNNDYRGVTRNEDIYSASAGLDYELTPHFHVGADYRYTTRSSNVAGTNYNQNMVEARVRLAL
jgi:hypothetical protein